MNNVKSMLVFLVVLLAGCTTMPTTDNTRKAFLYAEAGREQLVKAGELDSARGESVTVGEVYQLKESSEAVGLASDLGFGFGVGEATVGDVSLHTDRFALNLGLRYYFDTGTHWAQPYVGVGFSPTLLHVCSSVGDDQTAFAFAGYGLIGMDCLLGDSWRLGVAYRKSIGAEFDIGDAKRLNFNDSIFALTLGYSF